MTVAETAAATGAGSEQAYFESAPALLLAMAVALDIRSVLPSVSAIANALLPHDALLLAFVDGTGKLLVHATTADLPHLAPYVTGTPLPEAPIVGDLRVEALTPASEDLRRRALASGYRALMSVTAGVGEQMVALQFWSKRPFAFGPHGLPIAHRIAGHIALGVAHERLAQRGAPNEPAGPAVDGEGGAAAHDAIGRPDAVAPSGDIRIVGASAPWRQALRLATQVAATDTTVLLTGESGTGKEVLARYIHRTSPRHSGPFLALNCAALPEHLLESELFGFERGAFTGAQQSKPGLIELAAGGVLFLDEVTEMSRAAQAKFLRVLQEREFQRLGGTRVLKANVRVIGATNRPVRSAVERGDFREDLYYRLHVFPIAIPPLRGRRDDILPLSEALLHDIATALRRPPAGLTGDARRALLEHDWPGNVRELRNALERAAILAQGALISPEHLALEATAAPQGAVSTDLGTTERATISRVMRECRGNKSLAARRLGLTRTQLYLRLRKHGLEEMLAS